MSGEHIYGQDESWNVVLMMHHDGDVIHQIRYDAYGEFTIHDENGQQLSNSQCEFALQVGHCRDLFQGRKWDPETGLYYFRARFYSSLQGRYLV